MVPKMALIRGNGGLDVRFCIHDSKKAHPWAEPHVLAYFASKSVKRLGCSELKIPKKRKNKNLAIANRSRVSCAHNVPRASMITP